MTRHHPTLASRLAAVATLLIGLLLVPRMLVDPPTAILVLEAVGVVAAVAAAAGIWVTNSFESRLFAAILAVSAFGGAVLGVILGLPGVHGGGELNAGQAMLMAACLLTGVLLVVDSRLRRAQRESARRPYAL